MRDATLPLGVKRAMVAAPPGLFLKWCYRAYGDCELTALFNDTYLLAIPTGGLDAGRIAILVAPYKDEEIGHPRIVFSEWGTRWVNIPEHELRGRVVSERLCTRIPPSELVRCPPGTRTLSLDALETRFKNDWVSEMVFSALEDMDEKTVAAPPPLSFPMAWLACSRGCAPGDKKCRRGEDEESVPPPEAFTVINGRECLSYAEWHGSGVPVFSPESAPGWHWEPVDREGGLLRATVAGETEIRMHR